VLDENYEPQVIKNAENYKLADDSRPQVIANAEKYELAASRERLEADICDWLTHDLQGNPLYEVFADSVEPDSMPEIRRWLDRQAALTRAEVFEDGEYDCRTCDAKYELQERVDSLTAERDELLAELEAYRDFEKGEFAIPLDEAMEFTTDPPGYVKKHIAELQTERDDLRRITKELEERNGELLEGRAHWIDQAVSIYRRFYPHNEYAVPADVSSMVIAKIDELIAERDELRDKLDEKQHVCDVQRESFRKMEKLLADAKAADYTAMREEAEMLSAENARLKAENRELHMKVHGAPF
jgi:hypothetical protein